MCLYECLFKFFKNKICKECGEINGEATYSIRPRAYGRKPRCRTGFSAPAWP